MCGMALLGVSSSLLHILDVNQARVGPRWRYIYQVRTMSPEQKKPAAKHAKAINPRLTDNHYGYHAVI